MSLALYRKYRPATFAELKGQEHVAEPLQQALRNGRVHHAYLFSGPRGCGKTSSARILARSLNCEHGPTPEPCGECDPCVALGPTGAGHIDVIEIDAASHGGVDDARDLRERAFFAPVAARFKIYIIDEAHMVTREGFNALLKLVEEPPPHLKFIFATTEPEKVIGTIRSRTHHYPFRLIPPGVLRELLEDILQREGVPYEPAAIPLVVRAGAGSARDSESILDQLLAGAGEDGITYARATSLLGYTDAALLDEVVDAVAGRDGGAVFAAIDRVMEGGQDPRRFAADLLERFRDLVVLSNVPDSGVLDVPQDELERMRAQASRLGLAELTRAADLLHTGLTEMRGATAPRLLLELICARILLPGAYDDEASLLTRLERLERRLAIGEAPSRPQPEPRSRPEPRPQPDPPPAQGGDPTSIVQPRPEARESERDSVDNSADWPVPVRPPASPPPEAPKAPKASEEPERPEAPGGVDVAAVRRMWVDILGMVKQRSKVAWIVLMEGVEVASLDSDVLTLAFANEGKRRGFTTGGKDAVLREALREVLGVDWRIEAILGGGSGEGSRPAPPPPAPSPPRRESHAARRTATEQRVPSPSPPPDVVDEVDPEGDADAGQESVLTSMALIERELGGTVIQEIDGP
jgi:DNA polymerase III subunit gamma/tau